MSFAPGHVSLTFAVWPDEDPLKMGSTGIGLVLPQGVHCAVVDEQSESSENVVICGGKQIKDPVTLRALELIGFGNQGLTIYLRRDLPLGFGLGISGSSALAACLELEKDFEKSVKAAHQAEVEYKTGLGDVMAISASLKENIFPSIVIRESPGYGGEVITYPVKDKMVICLSGLGRDTSQILNNSEWTEIINTSSDVAMIEVPKWATEATAPVGTCSRISERFSFIRPAFSVNKRPVLIAVRRFTLVN